MSTKPLHSSHINTQGAFSNQKTPNTNTKWNIDVPISPSKKWNRYVHMHNMQNMFSITSYSCSIIYQVNKFHENTFIIFSCYPANKRTDKLTTVKIKTRQKWQHVLHFQFHTTSHVIKRESNHWSNLLSPHFLRWRLFFTDWKHFCTCWTMKLCLQVAATLVTVKFS